MLETLIVKLSQKNNLSMHEMQSAVDEILTLSNEAQIKTFLSLLSEKGETAEEIYAVVSYMQRKMVPVPIPYPIVDIVGTGGDGFNTVNVSTGAALLAASCGVKIAKHGNRSVSSMCGSADVIEALGLPVDLSPSQISAHIEAYNFSFLFAPNFHPVLATVKGIRKKLGIPTIFNLIGPLLNPCPEKIMMIGVAKKRYLELFADVLMKMNVSRAIVFNCQGLDEITPVGNTDIIEINGPQKQAYNLDPATVGIPYCEIQALQGADAAVNANILKNALQGEASAVADTLIMNAGFATYLYGICDTLQDSIQLAAHRQQTGSAYRLLQSINEVSHA